MGEGGRGGDGRAGVEEEGEDAEGDATLHAMGRPWKWCRGGGARVLGRERKEGKRRIRDWIFLCCRTPVQGFWHAQFYTLISFHFIPLFFRNHSLKLIS